MYCDKCGTYASDDAKFCTGCGNRFGAGAPPPEPAAQPIEVLPSEENIVPPAPDFTQPAPPPPPQQAVPAPPPAYQQPAPPPPPRQPYSGYEQAPGVPHAQAGGPPGPGAQPPPQQGYQPPPPGGGFGPPAGATAGDINFERGFQFISKTPGWVGRMFVLGLIACVPILNFAILGYFVELAQNVSRGQDTVLPDIKLGEQFGVGFMFFLAMLVFGLLAGLASAVVLCLSFLVSIAVQLYLKPGLAVAAVEGNPWAVFQFQRVFQALSKNFVPVLLLVLADMVIGMVAFSGIIACGVGVLFTLPFAFHISWHYTGQLGRLIKEQGL